MEGQEFIKHEFDEAIAVQGTIVSGAEMLAGVHPQAEAKQQMRVLSKEARRWQQQLEKHGRAFGATGKKEEVAEGIDQLARTTMENARSGEKHEVYEAHAVVLNAIRKQQDSAGAVVRIARSLKDTQLASAASEMQKAFKTTADQLAKSLSTLAVDIATDGQVAARATSGSARRSTTGGARSTASRAKASGSRSSGASARRSTSSSSGSKSSRTSTSTRTTRSR